MITYIIQNFDHSSGLLCLQMNTARLEIQLKQVQKVRNSKTFQWLAPNHWNVGLRRTDFTASLSYPFII